MSQSKYCEVPGTNSNWNNKLKDEFLQCDRGQKLEECVHLWSWEIPFKKKFPPEPRG